MKKYRLVDEMHIIDYCLEKQTPKTNKNMQKVNNHQGRKYPFDADKRVKFCPECKTIWEFANLNKSNGKIFRYDEIPKRGKKIELCGDCYANK